MPRRTNSSGCDWSISESKGEKGAPILPIRDLEAEAVAETVRLPRGARGVPVERNSGAYSSATASINLCGTLVFDAV